MLSHVIQKNIHSVQTRDILDSYCDKCGKKITNHKQAVIWGVGEETMVQHAACYFKKK